MCIQYWFFRVAASSVRARIRLSLSALLHSGAIYPYGAAQTAVLRLKLRKASQRFASVNVWAVLRISLIRPKLLISVFFFLRISTRHIGRSAGHSSAGLGREERKLPRRGLHAIHWWVEWHVKHGWIWCVWPSTTGQPQAKAFVLKAMYLTLVNPRVCITGESVYYF